MAKTYLVTKTDFDSAIGVDDTAGLRSRISTNETAIGDESGGLVKKTNDIESSVGATVAEGLRKKTADLETTVGLDDAVGLRKDMIDVKADIGADDTSGLRKRSADLETTVGTDDTSGLRKKVIDLESSVGVDDTTGLRKQVIDMINKPVAAWDVDSNTLENSNISVTGYEIGYFLGGMVADTVNDTVTVPISGLYRVTLHSIVAMSGLNLNQSASVEVRVDGVRVHQFRLYANTDLTYMPIGGSVTIPVNQSEEISFATRGNTVLYGSNGDYTACAIEYVRPLTD